MQSRRKTDHKILSIKKHFPRFYTLGRRPSPLYHYFKLQSYRKGPYLSSIFYIDSTQLLRLYLHVVVVQQQASGLAHDAEEEPEQHVAHLQSRNATCHIDMPTDEPPHGPKWNHINPLQHIPELGFTARREPKEDVYVKKIPLLCDHMCEADQPSPFLHPLSHSQLLPPSPSISVPATCPQSSVLSREWGRGPDHGLLVLVQKVIGEHYQRDLRRMGTHKKA